VHPLVRGLKQQIDPSWAPSGQQLAFAAARADAQFQIYIVAPDGHGLRRLTRTNLQDTDPVWSPDGTRIAFVEQPAVPGGYHGQARDLMVMNADGTNLHQLVHDPGGKSDLSWSPDGTRIMFTSSHILNREVSIVDVHTGATIKLGQIAGSAVWGPDGSHVAYVEPHPDHVDLVIASADGMNRRALISRPLARVPVAVAWSKDGRTIAFTSGPAYLGYYRLEIARTRDGRSGALTPLRAGRADTEPTFSPDSTRIAFVRIVASRAGTKSVIGVIHRDGTRLKLYSAITSGGILSSLSWRPDGG
jgi:Tol biopolymer transport system component